MKAQLLETQVRMQGEFPVVDARGEVIGDSGPILKQAIREATGRGPQVLVNMCDVAAMDSAGLGALIEASRHHCPGTLHFFGCSNRIQRLFEITGLEKVFDGHTSEEEALMHARETAAQAATPPTNAVPVW